MQNIGFIGTGLMGFPMAKNILKAGYKVKAFNRSINKAEPLKDFGAEISNSIGELVKASDVVITMLNRFSLKIFEVNFIIIFQQIIFVGILLNI